MRPPLGRLDDAACRMMQVGLVACVLAFIPGSFFGIERYDFPKEFVLHLFGLSAAGLCLLGRRRISADSVDLSLGAFVVLGALSTAISSINQWDALRAAGVTLSGVAVFWTARTLTGAGVRKSLLDALTLAVFVVAATVLLNSFGIIDDLPKARPGGTLGNRNYAGHLLAVGVPLLVLRVVKPQSQLSSGFALVGLTAASAALLMTRSRSAWLAVLVALVLLPFVAAYLRGRVRIDVSSRRVVLGVAACAAGIAFAVIVPNELRWTSTSPYLDTLRSLTTHDRGSGRGRLIQYRNSLRIASDHLALGVGPGNWKVVYPRYASTGDPTYHPEKIWPTPRRPTSDWLGFVTERGVPATLLLLAAFCALGRASWRVLGKTQDKSAAREDPLNALALLMMLVSLGVVSTLDAVLQQPAPTFLVFYAFGTLAPAGDSVRSLTLSRPVHGAAVLGILVAAVLLMLVSGRQIYATHLIARADGVDDWERASQVALGHYPLHTKLAGDWLRRGRCDRAFFHAHTALKYNPNLQLAERIRAQCDRK